MLKCTPVIALIFFLPLAGLSIATLSTDDGLELNLSESTGEPTSLFYQGQEIPFLPGAEGGWSFRKPQPASPGPLFHEDFSASVPNWSSAHNDDWSASAVYYTQLASGGIGDSPYLRLGNGSQTGCGIAFPEPINVTPGANLRCSWYGRSADIESKYIFCIRVWNAEGEDITEQCSAPSGWIYSGTSRAHCVFAMTNTTTNTWELFSYDYQVAEAATSVTISLRYWRDGDFYVEVDELDIETIGGVQFLPEVSLHGSLTPDGSGFVQDVVADDISFSVRYTPYAHYLRMDLELEDLSSPLRDRPLRIFHRLPLNLSGWQWGDDINDARTIEGEGTFENFFIAAGRKVSVYPWCVLADQTRGLSLALPMDVPRIQHSTYDLSRGLLTSFDLCLSPLTEHLGAGKASLTLFLFGFDGEWGFRAATQKYYELFPQFFVKRTQRDGCWLYPISPTLIPEADDFGFAFYEIWSTTAEVRDFCREHGIEIYYYMEPWGAWQSWGDQFDKPSYAERVAKLEEWAADTSSSATWLRAPRWWTAQAVIYSSFRDYEGKYYIDASDYFWHQWGTTANQLWPVYSDTDFTTVSTGMLYRDYWTEYGLDEKDGMYIDSIVTVGSGLGNLEDFNTAHFKHVKQPLCFSFHNTEPVLLSQLAQYDFIKWCSEEMHAQDKKLMGNMFKHGYRFYAHLLDIMGYEMSWATDLEYIFAQQRTLASQKNISNLLQWFHGEDYVTYEDMKEYIENQLFWGFFPGIASCGGGTGWGESIVRYFLQPELYERDRPLFKKYIPVIRELAAAGWQPITAAHTSSPDLRVERLGEWNPGAVYFTLKNTTEVPLAGQLSIDLNELNIPQALWPELGIRDVLNNPFIDVVLDEENGLLHVSLLFSAKEVKVINLQQFCTAASPHHWHTLP